MTERLMSDNSEDADRRNSLRTLERGLAVLDLLAESDTGLSFGQVGQRLGLSPGTVNRLLHTLVSNGYVEQDPRTKAYQLGLKIVELQGATIASTRIATEARPHLRNLMLQTGERVHLAVFRGGDHIVHIDRVDSQESIERYVPAGRAAPVHATSLGKAILAFSSKATIDEFFGTGTLAALTAFTITDINALRIELDEVRARGYSTEIEESSLDVCCVGAPVFDYTTRVVASVSIAGPRSRIEPRLDALGPLVRDTGEFISTTFGYRQALPT